MPASNDEIWLCIEKFGNWLIVEHCRMSGTFHIVGFRALSVVFYCCSSPAFSFETVYFSRYNRHRSEDVSIMILNYASFTTNLRRFLLPPHDLCDRINAFKQYSYPHFDLLFAFPFLPTYLMGFYYLLSFTSRKGNGITINYTTAAYLLVLGTFMPVV